VRYQIVRQHADQKNNWHTEPKHVRGIVATALEKTREAWHESNNPA
jgi:hypothetical protein